MGSNSLISAPETPELKLWNSVSMSSTAQVPAKKQQDLQVTYSNYKNTLQQIAQRIGDIEQEAEEHKLVLETLEPLSEDRKCFRLINGVLVERTVKDVKPALQTNQEGLRKVLDDLVKQYKTKQDDLEKWKKKHNVQVVQQ
ncbi:hypothetical protein KAF25_007362 [Fusarium avenaceum]|uniref:Prefoldin subunit 2 n=1 Tax=Fusarium avenaceum TaxID=40199 RepID=A0A9P7GXU1_9HYPO|nr:hypothetical protein KAF25_007362 [Fusarium avenaceum]